MTTSEKAELLRGAEFGIKQYDDWDAPIPLSGIAELPTFPLEVLPQIAQEFVASAADAIQAPLDMVGTCLLGVLEISCRGRYPVRLPNGHIERPCFYIAPIAPPSERKSGVIEVVTRPLISYETEYNQEHDSEVAQSRSEQKLLQGRIANAERTAVNAKDADNRDIARHELRELNEELISYKAIEPLRLYGADVTPEKLAEMLKRQDEVFALVSAEGDGLFENIGRYTDKGGLEIYLNGYSGDRVCVDRKSSESIVISKPTLNIIAPCQPSVIKELFDDKQKSGRGLLSRILYVKCATRVGTRKAVSSPIDERVANNYHNLCYSMLAGTSRGDLEYNEAGFDVYCRFFDKIEPQLNPSSGELSYMADWAGKLHGQMTRLAGLIHCINAFSQRRDPLATQISGKEAQAASKLAEYYLEHAKAVYTEQDEPESESNARYLWEKIQNITSIGKRELIRKTQSKTGFDLNESLAVLSERGYVRIDYTQTKGRPAETITINPRARTIVTKVTKVTKGADLEALDTKYTLVTMPVCFPKPAMTANCIALSASESNTEEPCRGRI